MIPFRSFRRDARGSLAPAFALVTIPLLAAIGFSVDYSSGSATRAGMQDALDAATLAAATLSSSTSDADRQQKLADSYAANGGPGTATMTAFSIDSDGTAHVKASASYQMPTSFMRIAMIDKMGIDVASAVNKKPSLVQATFKVTGASGWWNKTMYLYGTPFGSSTPQQLMKITYVYNNQGDPKGYGTTTAYTITTNAKGKQTTKQVQQQVCTTATNCKVTPANGTGAVIDVSQMSALYLEMDVPSGNPSVLKTNDPTTSDRLFIDGTEVASGKIVDIFTAVPCGETSNQAWEDGGSRVPEPISDADFFYSVTGKCDLNQRPSDSLLTQ